LGKKKSLEELSVSVKAVQTGAVRRVRASGRALAQLKSAPEIRRNWTLNVGRSMPIGMMTDNIFQKIIDRKIPANIVYEDERCLAFKDINPQAPVHVLIIPKTKVIPTHDDLTEEDIDLLGHLHLAAAKLAKQLGIADGYRVVVNCKERAGQTVPHLHFHLLGGREMRWPPG
jgi:histidine triad (HIT) family protein